MNQVIEEALSEAKTSLEDINAVAVTYGPVFRLLCRVKILHRSVQFYYFVERYILQSVFVTLSLLIPKKLHYEESELNKLLKRDLSEDYPPTAREVLKFYSRILCQFYGDTQIEDDDFDFVFLNNLLASLKNSSG